MVTANKNKLALFKKLHHKSLHFKRFAAPVHHVAANDELVRFVIRKKARIQKRFAKLAEKAVYIGNNIISHNAAPFKIHL